MRLTMRQIRKLTDEELVDLVVNHLVYVEDDTEDPQHIYANSIRATLELARRGRRGLRR